MVKLMLDWTGDKALIPVGESRAGVWVSMLQENGPAGWPVIAVWAPDEETMRTWLMGAYGSDAESADELLSLKEKS